MCPLLVVSEVRPNPLRHDHDERPIIHVRPIAASNQLIVGVASERAIGVATKIGLVKTGHRAQITLKLYTEALVSSRATPARCMFPQNL